MKRTYLFLYLLVCLPLWALAGYPANYNVVPLPQSIVEQKPLCEYVLLRNVFDSISESENKASFTSDELRNAARQGIIDRNVIAEGGVALGNIEQVREWGFGGVAIRGDLWNHFDVHSQRDYKDLIAHFRRLRKAVG